MKRRLALAGTLCLLLAALAHPQAAPAPAAPAPEGHGAKVWIGHEAEYEEYLKTQPIDHIEDVPVGVTKPKRIFFANPTLAHSAALKHLPPRRQGGFWESYKSEIAAYEMDRVLDLEMVPVTVERRVEADLGSVQLWVDNCKLLKDVKQSDCPRPMDWAVQVWRQRVFDNLIANIDRNQGNLLVDDQWNLILIDHSRAFATNGMPFEKTMERIDRTMFDRLKALDEPTLMKKIRPWVLGDGSVRDILKRRDKIVARFEKLAAERGEIAVFPVK